MSGDIQQLVCPYIVSGLRVAATRYTGFPDTRDRDVGYGATGNNGIRKE